MARWPLSGKVPNTEVIPMRTLCTTISLLALFAAIHVAAAQSGNAPFCLKTPTGQVRCSFATMGECERARPNASSGQCITRSDAGGTTGLGEPPTVAPGAPGGQLPER
jgi:hypothetical protein